MKRRQFLRQSSLGTLAVATTGSLAARSADRVAGANERIRVGIVGFSNRFGSSLSKAFHSLSKRHNCEFIGVSDIWNRRRDEGAAYIEKLTGRKITTYRNNEELYEKGKLEYRLFWPYSSGICGQWMCHQIDTVHWFTGLPHPRSVSANGGIYLWKDGRTNFDTLTAVFDYGPLDDPAKGFQVIYSSRFTNSAGGTKEIYYSNGGELNLATRQITPNGGLKANFAKAMGMKPNLLDPRKLEGKAAAAAANTGTDPMTSAHMANWLECLRSRKKTHAPVEAGYHHAIATIMANAAARTGKRVTFDEKTQEVMAGDKVFRL